MGCNKDKILNIEDRLAEIQARKAEIAKLKNATKAPINVPEGEIGINNSKGKNKLFRASDGKVKREISIVNNQIEPKYKNLNTINGRSDEMDDSRLNDPRLKKGDTVKVQLIENDYWRNNKWQFKDAPWAEAPLYIVDETGTPIELLESYKDNKKGTNKRKEIYEALQQGKEVTLTIKDKMYNFNNMQFAGSPVFLNVRENLTPTLLKDSNGEIIEAPANQQPILAVATGIETDHWGQSGVPMWQLDNNLETVVSENENIERAVRNDIGTITPIFEGQDKNTAAGQVAAVMLAPDGKYTVAYLSTRTLSDKAIEYVLKNIAEKNMDNIAMVVPNNTNLEKAFKNPKFLNIFDYTYRKENKMAINFFSESHAEKDIASSIIKIDSEELTKAINGEKFTYETGVFGIRGSEKRAAEEEIAKGGSPKAPNAIYIVKKKIVSLPGQGVDIVSEFKNLLKAKKHQVEAGRVNSTEGFQIPGLTKKYNTYQDYLFDPEAHGEQFNLVTDGVNHKAILNTDIKRIDGSIFFNTTLTFSDLLIDGKSTTETNETNIKTDLSPGTSSRASVSGPRVRVKKARTKSEQIAAEKEKLDQCGF